MKRHTFAASVMLTVLALLGLAWPVSAGEQVPFHGSFAGVFTFSGFPVETVSANLTGNATHLGRFTLALPYQVDLLAAPPSSTGTFVFIAATGDVVFGSFTGAVDSAALPLFHLTEVATIEGGTGRFSDASGSFTISRSGNLDLLTASGSFNGTISSPGK